MAQVVVRNVDDEAIARLKSRAARKGHSLEQELRLVIVEASREDHEAFWQEAAKNQSVPAEPRAFRQHQPRPPGSRPVKLVVDASIAVKWFVPEGDDEPAERLRDGKFRLLAPELMKVEFANALWKKRRKGEIDDDGCRTIIHALTAGAIRYTPDGELFGAAFQLACHIDHPVYDCLYLALADAQGAKMVSADGRLLDKARAAGLDRLVLPLADI